MTGTHLLHLDSSASGRTSVSRQLGRALVDDWAQRETEAVLTYRDLNAEPVPFVSDTWVAAAYSSPDQRDYSHSFALSRSEALIRELEAADVLVIGAPMYNFGVPASLKAWIDQVVRIGRTFAYDGPNPIGLVYGKRAIVIATSGGDARLYESLGLDFRSAYLRAILGFIGIVEVDVVTVTDTMTGQADLVTARNQINELLDQHFGSAVIAEQRSRSAAPKPADRTLS